MEPDKYQQAWQAHSSQTRVTVDADLLLKEVQRNQRDFRATILRRDILEVGVGLLMLPYWIYQGLTSSLPWTWWLGVPAIIWVVGFFLVDRIRHPQTPSDPGEPLLSCVQNSLTQVEHQIWLLRNIFWWYLLPFTIAILAFFTQVAWQRAVKTNDWLAALAFATFLFVFVLALYSFIYYLNQRAVRTQLEPRRQELLKLLTSLSDESTSDGSSEYPILMGREGVKRTCSSRRTVVAGLCFVAILLIGVPGILYFSESIDEWVESRFADEYPKRSPYAAIRWQDTNPEVELDGEWFRLFGIDYLPTAEIVAFSQKTYGRLWQKRFEEDLVELLSRMGHPPKDKVQLVVQTLSFPPETRTLNDVPMTRANRRAIRDAAQAPEHSEK